MLNHLNILELSNVLAGPAVGMFFSELGANVVKIENKITVAITVASAIPSIGISAGITAVIGAERKRLTQTDKILSARLLIPIKMPIGIPTTIDKESPIPKVLAVIINASQKADC